MITGFLGVAGIAVEPEVCGEDDVGGLLAPAPERMAVLAAHEFCGSLLGLGVFVFCLEVSCSSDGKIKLFTSSIVRRMWSLTEL